MSNLPRRPKTIWITQILLVLVGIPFTLMAMLGILRAFGAIIEVETSREALALYAGILLSIGMVFLFVFAFWGLARRKRYGRWFSVAIVVFFLGSNILGQFYRPQGPIGYYEYENANQQMGGIFATIIIVGLFGFLLYRLVFGESVSDFFSGIAADDMSDTPPPPPEVYFDPASSSGPGATKRY